MMVLLSNPRSQSIRFWLSDGSVRIVGPWGLAVLPEYSRLGQRLEVTAAEVMAVPSVAALPTHLVPPPGREHAA